MSLLEEEGEEKIIIFIKDVSEEFKSTRNVIRDKYRQKALCTLREALEMMSVECTSSSPDRSWTKERMKMKRMALASMLTPLLT